MFAQMPNVESEVGGSVEPQLEGDPSLHFDARQVLRQFSAAEPARHPVPHFLLSWLLTIVPLALAVLALHREPSFGTAALAFVVTGFVQNGLGLLIHEGSHYFFHPDKRTNDVLADVLVCLPLFNTVAGYRAGHFEHHRFSGSAADPYWGLYAGYRGRAHLALCLIADLLLVTSFVKFFERYVRPSAPSSPAPPRSLAPLVGLVLVQGALAGGYALATGTWYGYFVFWVLPLLTIPAPINRMRTLVEHEGSKNRGTAPGLIEYLLVAPYGYSYHFEHHLLPSIPYYKLGRAHRALEAAGIALTRSELSSGYLRTFFQILRAGPST